MPGINVATGVNMVTNYMLRSALRRRGEGAETAAVPRVAVFDGPTGSVVQVIRVEPSAGVGDRIRHLGRTWRISGTRTHERVLICQPAEG